MVTDGDLGQVGALNDLVKSLQSSISGLDNVVNKMSGNFQNMSETMSRAAGSQKKFEEQVKKSTTATEDVKNTFEDSANDIASKYEDMTEKIKKTSDRLKSKGLLGIFLPGIDKIKSTISSRISQFKIMAREESIIFDNLNGRRTKLLSIYKQILARSVIPADTLGLKVLKFLAISFRFMPRGIIRYAYRNLR